jgi:GxxExxY protein
MSSIADFSFEMNDLTGKIINAAVEVHRVLGPGYLESIYEEALSDELNFRKIPFERQKQIAVNYKGQMIGEGRLDLLIDKKVIVELKAVDHLAPIHKAQVLSYLKATNLQVALLINFNTIALKDGLKRIVRST